MNKLPGRLLAYISAAVFIGVIIGLTIFIRKPIPDISTAGRFGPDIDASINTANTSHSDNLNRVVRFVEQGDYRHWQHDPYIRVTGDVYRTPEGKIIDGSTHHRVRIYYSPDVVHWLEKCRNARIKPEGNDCAVDNNAKALPDGATMVKEMYQTVEPTYPAPDPVIGWAVMVRKNGASPDGWFWVIHFKKAFRTMATMGTFSYSFCLSCHASAINQSSFASYQHLTGDNPGLIHGRSFTPMATSDFMSHIAKSDTTPSGDVKAHRSQADPDFLAFYARSELYPDGNIPRYSPSDTGPVFPGSGFDHVWNQVPPMPPTHSYLTSYNCAGCHNATSLVDTNIPNMLYKMPTSAKVGENLSRLINLSVYGEWRTSPMGMAGRDPVFFAQMESEINTYPDQAKSIENLCFSCHGNMGQRQFEEDKAKPENRDNPLFQGRQFDLSMVFATSGPYAKYGALARDGISCQSCHQMDPEHINVSPDKLPGTGHFTRSPDKEKIYGSTPDNEVPGGPIRTTPMKHALGLTPVYDPYINNANLCGTCHTIQLAVRHPDTAGHFHGNHPVDRKKRVMLSRAHEQNTYHEWLYSGYQTSTPMKPAAGKQPMTCQQCHMAKDVQGNGRILAPRVANVQNGNWPVPASDYLAALREITTPPRPEVGRHSFFGMNLFALTFYEQFTQSIFGLSPDSFPPAGTVPGQRFALEDGQYQVENTTASVQILDTKADDSALTTKVLITNKAGHRLPSGVGFRRAWIEFRVLNGKGQVIWASGLTNHQGAILNGHTEYAPLLTSEFTDDWKELQPHWEVITREDQVQIYEERYINKMGDDFKLNTSFLGIGKIIKDNRLLPSGYQYRYIHDQFQKAKQKYDKKPTLGNENDMEKWESLLPACQWGASGDKEIERLTTPMPEGGISPNDDEKYRDGSGSDLVTYRIPLKHIPGARQVTATLFYQNMPPYYLRDRFMLGRGPQTQRLYYLIGHTETRDTPIRQWKIAITGDRKHIP